MSRRLFSVVYMHGRCQRRRSTYSSALQDFAGTYIQVKMGKGWISGISIEFSRILYTFSLL